MNSFEPAAGHPCFWYFSIGREKSREIRGRVEEGKVGKVREGKVKYLYSYLLFRLLFSLVEYSGCKI